MISLNMIVKGSEWEETKRCLASVENYVDRIYITTTQTKSHPKHDKVVWSHFPWVNDFSKARNFNLKQSEERYILWLDSDDVVEKADQIPLVVEAMEQQKIDVAYVDYNYEIDRETGEVVIVHPRERILRNDGTFSWKGSLHETMIASRPVRSKYIKDFIVNHYPDPEEHAKGIKRNLEIMVKQYQEERKAVMEGEREEIDPRTEFILARILFDLGSEYYQRSAELFQDYIQHSGWDDEKAQAWNYLARIFMSTEHYDDAINCCLAAKKESPQYPSWDIMLANIYCATSAFDKAEIYINQALALKEPKTALIVSPLENKINALIALFLIAFNKKELKDALEYAEGIYKLKRNKENKERVETVSKLLRMGDWMKALGGMVESMGQDWKRIKGLLDNLPKDLENTAYLQQLRGTYLPPKTWSDKSIVYYAASDLEPWSPKSLEKGIGGSEEAIIFLSKEWVRLGYEVTVFANVAGPDEGEYDGVKYVNYHKFNPHDHFNILIGWRNPLLFKYNLFSSKLTLLDLHDVPVEKEYLPEVLNRIDYIMVKSDFHRSLLPNVPDHKFKIIGNGIDVEKLKKIKGKHKRYKIFWGSSYDRGLQNILEMWPEIIKEEPLAELHICYGWQLFDKVYEGMPKMKKWRKQMEAMMTQKGIIEHGRVGKDQLYKIAADCGIWAYPTEFEEIDCITARYNQALGTLPVVSNYAALKSTVKYGIKVDTTDGKHLDKTSYLVNLAEAIKGPLETKKMREYALDNFGWDKRAKEWKEVFEVEQKQDIKVSVITPTIRTGWWNVMADNLSKQSYKNFEWIIVDDYKEDRKKIADKYAKKYGLDIKYLRGPKRTAKVKRKYGLSSANNHAWKNADGELCVWLQDFVLLEEKAVESLVRVYSQNRYSFICPVDTYHAPKSPPNLKNTEDWWDGDTDVVGKFMRKNARIGLGWLRESDTLYDLELNFGAIPKKLLEDLNGFWEFYDEALGYDDTEIVYRGKKLGATLIVDERTKCICLDHWEALKDNPEELGEDRIHNLNDPRFIWMVNKIKTGKLPIKRDQKLDDQITLKYEIPKDLDQDEAVEWMEENLDEIVEGWK